MEIKVDARDLIRTAKVYEAAGKDAPKAIARAINWTGDKARTQVGRTLAKQTGMPYGKVREGLVIKRASPGQLSYDISSSGRRISLKYFAARQTAGGVSASPWGHRRVFPRTFMGPGGHVFRRLGRARLPIVQLWGPGLSAELVRGATPKAFSETVKQNLSARLKHELDRLFPAK